MLARFMAFLLFSITAIPGHSQVFGSLANFDVVNDTGEDAHGFEIDIEGIHSSDITSLFGAANRWPNMERYGSPTVTDTGTGVRIVYQANYNGAWSATTPSGGLKVSPSDSCWPLGAKDYGPKYPCDHFGVSTSKGTPNVTYSWLVGTDPNNTTLKVATVPNPVWTVTPVPPKANVPQPPQVNVVIAAPQPLQYEFGEPRWVKVTATGTLQNVAVEDLVAENAVIKKANTQTQVEWQLLQVDSGNPGSGQIDLTGVQLDEGAKGVVYRFEFYKYTGKRDLNPDSPTNEALPGPNGDTPGANGPSPGDLGDFIVAQNAGINFDGKIPPAPPIPLAPTLNASISGATVNSPYSQAINATPGNAGDTLTFSITKGVLPNGLQLNGNIISGTPQVVGAFPFTLTVTDTSNGLTTSGSTSIQVADAAIVFPNPFNLNAGTVGLVYNQPLTVTGGFGAITFADFYHSLPPGLTINGSAITGTPTTVGSPSVTITATDSLGYSQVATATLNVSAAAAPTPCSGINQVISSGNQTSLNIVGGQGNGGQTVIPPANINYQPPATQIVAGDLASFSGTLDNNGYCAAATLTIASGLSLSSPTQATLPIGFEGNTYPSIAVSPVGGIKPYSLSVSGLPNGMTFDGIKIAGTPALGTHGTSTISIAVTDAISEKVNSSLSLTINPVQGNQFTAQVTTSGYIYSRATKQYYTTVHVKNSGAHDVTGPVSVLFANLPAGVTLVNPSGTFLGNPYLTIPSLSSAVSKLAKNQIVSFPVQFNATTGISFTPTVYSGSLKP